MKNLFTPLYSIRTIRPIGWVPSTPDWLYRGYTGHEKLAQSTLINMNGRLYDPVIGRMMGPDPIISDFTNSQDFNGYSYVLNNPLRFTDASGYKYKAEGHELEPVTVYGTYDTYVDILDGYGGYGGYGGPGCSGCSGCSSSSSSSSGGNNPDVTIVAHLNPITVLPGTYNNFLFWQRMLANQRLMQENELAPVTVHAVRPKKEKKTTSNGYDLNPNSVGHNYFSSIYIGPYNPRSYNDLKYYYNIEPKNRADAAARQHDLGYDKKHAKGVTGVLFNTEVLPADFKLIGNKFVLAVDPFNKATFTERGEAFLMSLSIGIAILPKIMMNGASKIKN